MTITKQGYDQIRERIINRQIEPPGNLTATELQDWLTGYAMCQKDVLDIIDEIEGEQFA